MKILLAVVSISLVSLLHLSQCESFRSVIPPPPPRPLPPPLPPIRRGCSYEPENRTVAAGESFMPKGRCVVVTCLESGNLRELACGHPGAPCKNPRIENEDFTKPYPDCCIKVHCD